MTSRQHKVSSFSTTSNSFFFLWRDSVLKPYRFPILQSTDSPFCKVQIFHFQKYRFSILQSTDSPLRFESSHFRFAMSAFLFVCFKFLNGLEFDNK